MDSLQSDQEQLRRQHALKAEAHRVLDELDLMAELRRVGEPAVVGRLALGLIVWRDIYIEVQCERLYPDLAFEAVRRHVSPGPYRMTFHDWIGSLAFPNLPDGYYCGVRYQPTDAEQ